jgi:Rod binding domain-containing protein
VIPELAAQPMASQSLAGAMAAKGDGSPKVSNQAYSAKEQKLRRAAAEFESILISTFWKSMKDSFSTEDDDSLDPGHSSYELMGLQAMAGAMSKAGGLGLGKLILKHLAPQVESMEQATRS